MKSIVILLAMSLLSSGVCAQAPLANGLEDDVIAVVLGNKITIKDKDRLDALIFGVLLEQFANDNMIEPTDEELDAFVKKTEEKEKQNIIKMEHNKIKLMQELEDHTLSEQQREQKTSHLQTIESLLKTRREMKKRELEMEEQMRPIRRQMAQQFVRAWKINKALYEKYGGRVIFQQAGVEPLDAYLEFLREQENKGAFRILDKKYEANFWRYFTNDAMHTFYSKDDGAKFINTPWWMMDQSAVQ